MPSLKVICTSSNRIKLSVASSDMAAAEEERHPLLLLHPSFYIYIQHTHTHIYIFFFNVPCVFVFIYLCPIFKTALVYTHGFAIALRLLLYTIPDSFWPGSGYLKIDIYISCRCVYLKLDFFFLF
jgi:hypothetical protein